MASLPLRSFMFNYNAKDYNSTTYTFPKTQGQIFDEDLVLNKAPASYTDEYVDFGNSQAYTGRTNYSNYSSPFNRTSSNNSFTFIYKTSGWTDNSNTNLFSNRYPAGRYNYFVRGVYFFGQLGLTAQTNPNIIVIRVNADGTSIKRVVDSSGNTLQSTSLATQFPWGSTTNGFGFFSGYANGGEYFNKKFYWMYCSLEALTDEEIVQVIKYNEGISNFGLDTTALTFDYQSSSVTVELTSDNPWTASTNDSWVRLSDYSGASGQSITVSVLYNPFEIRTGVIVFTDGEESVTLVVTQNANNAVPIIKIMRNGNRIN